MPLLVILRGPRSKYVPASSSSESSPLNCPVKKAKVCGGYGTLYRNIASSLLITHTNFDCRPLMVRLLFVSGKVTLDISNYNDFIEPRIVQGNESSS